jgi:cell division protein FtsW
MHPGVRTDWCLVGGVLALLVAGLLMVWSATQYVPPKNTDLVTPETPLVVPPGDAAGEGPAPVVTDVSPRAIKQAMWAVVGLLLLMFFRARDYRGLNHPAWAFGGTGLALGLLALAYVIGERHRFLRWGPVGIQPSELAKPALVIFLAYFIAQRARILNDSRTLAPAAATLGLLTGAVMIADLGTAFVMIVTAGAVFVAAGLEWRHVRTAAAVGVLCTLPAMLVPDYRRARVEAFLYELGVPQALGLAAKSPAAETGSQAKPRRDASYHQKQSLLALGSGGWRGVGWFKGRQKLGYLPEADNDFIFAVVGEELGLVGCGTLMLMFLLIWWRGLQIARRAPDDFGRSLALGAAFIVIFQAMVHISVVVKLAPAKGLPLPMISYGGSSLVATMILFGMLLSIRERSV